MGSAYNKGISCLIFYKKRKMEWGKGENNFNVEGINELILHPTSSVWGKR
jgi:hypothetical protein